MERPNLFLITVFVFLGMVWLFAGAGNRSFAAESDWRLVKEKDGIRIYNREIDGSSFKPYRGVMTVEAPLAALVCLVSDAGSYPDWVDTCVEGKILKKDSPSKSFIYTVNEAPWPVSDRDSIVETRMERDQETGAVHIRLTGVPDYIPETEDYIRVKKINGFWRFTPLEGNRVEIVHQVHTEPGGALPAWLVNSVVVNQPFRTLENMRAVIRRPEYQGVSGCGGFRQ